MNAFEMVKLWTPMPKIKDIKVLDGQHRILVLWQAGLRAGKEDVVDLTPLIGCFKFYRELAKDLELFKTAHLIEDGQVVAWGDGEIDMPATSIERLAEESMSADEFREFLLRHQLTHEAAAAVIGRSRRQIENYLAGHEIPRVVALACIGFEARQREIFQEKQNPTFTIFVAEPMRTYPTTAGMVSPDWGEFGRLFSPLPSNVAAFSSLNNHGKN